MKFINLLFSIYIIALSCMPCADAENIVGNKTACIQNETNSPSDKHNDACSPFCNCNCCNCNGFYKATDYASVITPVKIEQESSKIEYTSTLFSNFHNSIWQPPQIS